MYLIHTDKRENNDIKIFYFPGEYGQNFSPISNLGKFIIYVNNENVGDVKFYEKDIIDDEIIEREDGNYEDLDDLNKILEQFKGFFVNEGEGRYCER